MEGMSVQASAVAVQIHLEKKKAAVSASSELQLT